MKITSQVYQCKVDRSGEDRRAGATLNLSSSDDLSTTIRMLVYPGLLTNIRLPEK
jgi:hypothetical protein